MDMLKKDFTQEWTILKTVEYLVQHDVSVRSDHGHVPVRQKLKKLKHDLSLTVPGDFKMVLATAEKLRPGLCVFVCGSPRSDTPDLFWPPLRPSRSGALGPVEHCFMSPVRRTEDCWVLTWTNVLSACVLGANTQTQCYTRRNIGGWALDSDIYACCFCLCSVKSTQYDVFIVKLCRDINYIGLYIFLTIHTKTYFSVYLFHLKVSGHV